MCSLKGKMMRLLIRAALLILTLSASSYAQSDWHTYPVRSIADLIQAHSGETSVKPDIIISADPFPSKTVATYTGKHRPASQYTKDFIDLWAKSRNLPPENAGLLVEEYLFKEKDKEYWIPVHKKVVPVFDLVLEAGDEITIYYFFLGGYNEKQLREKEIKKDQTKAKAMETVEDRITWIFAVEKFQK
jgi:hypothetical protein